MYENPAEKAYDQTQKIVKESLLIIYSILEFFHVITR